MNPDDRSMQAELRRAMESLPAPYRELYSIALSGHRATGFTIHRGGDNRVLPTPASLTIAQIGTDKGFYLIYRDDQGNVLTDTYHPELHDAFEQAAAEFGVRAGNWTRTSSSSEERDPGCGSPS